MNGREAAVGTRDGGDGRTVRALGLATGVAVAVYLAFLVLLPSPAPMDALAGFRSNPAPYFGAYFSALAAAAVGIPFVSAVGRRMGDRSSASAAAASGTASAALLVLVLDAAITFGGTYALTQFSPGPAFTSNAQYAAAFLDELYGPIALVGWTLLGMGLLLFALASWSVSTVPRAMRYWLAAAGVVGLATVGLDPIGGPLVPAVALASLGFFYGTRREQHPCPDARGSAVPAESA